MVLLALALHLGEEELSCLASDEEVEKEELEALEEFQVG